MNASQRIFVIVQALILICCCTLLANAQDEQLRNLGNLERAGYQDFYAKRYDVAIETFSKALEIAKQIENKEHLIYCYVSRLQAYVSSNKYAEVIKDASSIISIISIMEGQDKQKYVVQAFASKGNAYNQLKNYDSAVVTYLTAIERFPTVLEFSNGLVWNLLFKKDFRGAIEQGTKALKINIDTTQFPMNPKIYITGNLAHAYLMVGQFDSAKVLYLKYKGAYLNDKLWENTIVNDFVEFRQNGIKSNDFVRVERLLLPKGEYASVDAALLESKECITLNLSGQNLKTLPSEFIKLTNLEELYLTQNPDLNWENVFVLLGKLPKLKTLILANNNIKNISTEISLLQNLEVLGIGLNQGLNLRKGLLFLAKLPKLTTLNLSFCMIEELPVEISMLKNLRSLYLANNWYMNWKSAFQNLSALPNLKTLAIASNQIGDFPEEITQLQNLEELDCHVNAIQWNNVLPKLRKMPKLKSMVLDVNDLREMWGIEDLQNLEKLSLKNNLFSDAEQKRIQEKIPKCKVSF